MNPQTKAHTAVKPPIIQPITFWCIISCLIIYLHSLKPPATIPVTSVIVIWSCFASYFTRPIRVKVEPSKAINYTVS